MKIHSILLTSVCCVVSITCARAADAIVEREPVPVAPIVRTFSWDGVYLGGQVGYGWGKSAFGDGVNSQSMKPDGFIGGVYAGYNVSVGQSGIVGIDGDVAYSNQKDRQDLVGSSGRLGSLESRLRWSGAVRGRIGVAMGRVLPYIAGGVAFAGMKNSMEVQGLSAAQNFSASQNKTLTGWTAGAGLEYAATDNMLLRVEYRYNDLGKRNFDFGTGVNVRDNVKSNEVRLGVAYKF